MSDRQVEVSAHAYASANAVWAIAGQFCGAWHPAIATIQTERDHRGSAIRAFTVAGEDTLYREQLIYYSDTDRELRYVHLQGIAGVDDYEGRLRIEPLADDSCNIVCSASITAPAPRCDEIATGTRAVFQGGVDALLAIAGEPAKPVEQRQPRVLDETDLDTIAIAGKPELCCTVTQAKAQGLCIFLHGIGGARDNWRAQLPAVPDSMRAVAMDLRGYGDSAAGADQSTVDDYCRDILRVRDAFGARKIVLCGLSFGAWIATSFAMRHPQLLSALVLSGGCTGMSQAGVDERDAFRRSREVPLDAGQTPADFAAEVVDVIAGPNAADEVRRQLLDSMSAISVHTYRDALNCFTRPTEIFDFSRLTMPVLMMTGEHDRLAPPGEIRAVADTIVAALNARGDVLPDVQFEVIDDAGHVCNLERPQAYNRLLQTFLARLSL